MRMSAPQHTLRRLPRLRAPPRVLNNRVFPRSPWTAADGAAKSGFRARCVAPRRGAGGHPDAVTARMNAPVAFRRTSTLAIVSLVSGLLGWSMLPFIGSLVAIVTGHLARSEIRRRPDAFEGDGLAVTGLVLGYAMVAMSILGLLFVFLVFGGVMAAIAAYA